MGRLGHSQVAGVLGVLFMIGAMALAGAAQPNTASMMDVAPLASPYPKPTPRPTPKTTPRPAPAPGAPSEPPGPPRPVSTPAHPPYSREEPFVRSSPGVTIYSSGPTTRGSVIHVAGRQVQLPPDAYIEHSVAFISCFEPGCPEAPYYVLRRGESTVGVSRRSGARFGEEVAPGEEGAFDFLPDAAPGDAMRH